MKLPQAPRAVITGAASGLGRAIALQLARTGGRVLVADVAMDRARETAADIERAGGQAAVVECDVGDAAQVAALADEAERRWGGTDLLVNNAGVACAGPVGDIKLDDWQWCLRINLWGVVHGCHAFVPRMKAQRGGFILNVASSAGIASFPEMGPYNVSKAGVISLTETLQGELAPYGIGVSVLCPTFFKTNLMDNFRSPAERHRKMAEAFFRRATMTAEQVAVAGLRGLERGELVIIPQRDGKAVYHAKRFTPSLYFWGVRAQQRRGLMSKLVGAE